jgi:rubrerythrin
VLFPSKGPPIVGTVAQGHLVTLPRPLFRNWCPSGEDVLVDVPLGLPGPDSPLGFHAFPDVTIRPFTRYLSAVLAPTDAGRVTAITLDVDLPLARWLDARWVKADTGEPLVFTTSDHPRAGTLRVRTYGELIDIWRRADDQFSEPVSPQDHVLQRGARRARPVVSRPELIELVGKEGDDLLRQLSDPLSTPDDDLTIYREADRWPNVLASVKGLGSRELSKRGGLTLRTAQRVVRGETVSDDTKARVTAVVEELALAPEVESVNTCARPGCGRRIAARRRWCSDSCRKKAERGRDAVDLHKAGAKRCVKCGAVLYGEKASTCPSCGGEGLVQVRTFSCPNCGVERVGDTEGPCPVCEKGTK